MREELIARMIHIYGLENPIVIWFCRLCEEWEDREDKNHLLEEIVKAHEEYPYSNDKDKEEDAQASFSYTEGQASRRPGAPYRVHLFHYTHYTTPRARCQEEF